MNMLSLIVCCGLLFSVASASSNDETSNERINISKALPVMPNLSSTVTPSCKPCDLEMKDSEISQIVELFNNDLVHVVNISVSLSTVSHGKELLFDFHVQLMNPIGREILFVLQVFTPRTTSPWSLTVGIREFKLHAVESQDDCIRHRRNATEFTVATEATQFAFESIRNIVRTINLATKYDVWYSFKDFSSGEERKNCCHITKTNFLECNDGCSVSNSYLFRSGLPWVALLYILIFLFSLSLTWLFFHFESRTHFNVEYSKFYKLEESNISPSFLFFKIIWEEKGRLIACIRVCLLTSVLAYLCFLWNSIFLGIRLYAIVAVFYVIVCLFPRKRNTSSMHKDQRIKIFMSLFGRFLVWCGYDEAELRQELTSCENIGIIKMLTSPFNVKFWRKTSETVNQKLATFTSNYTLRFLTACPCYAFVVFIYLFLVCALPFYFLAAVIYFLFYRLFSLLSLVSKLKHWCVLLFLPHLTILSVLFFVVWLFLIFLWTFVVIPMATVSLVLGLFLNLIFFIPYLAFLSILIFYSVSYWKSMEEKYLVLKRIIYETCRDTQNVDNDIITNRRLKEMKKYYLWYQNNFTIKSERNYYLTMKTCFI